MSRQAKSKPPKAKRASKPAAPRRTARKATSPKRPPKPPAPSGSLVIVMVRPKTRPAWWPKGDDGRPAWASICYSVGAHVYGYNIGKHASDAVRESITDDVKEHWNADFPDHTWEFKIEAA